MRKYLFFVVSALTMLLGSIDGTAVVVAFPEMVAEFQTNLAWLGWVFSAYYLAIGVMTPLVGRISETIGVRRAFLGAVSFFLAGSVGCAMAPTVEILVVFRAVQAIGAAAFMPLSTGIVSRTFPDRRSQMIGLLTTIWPIGSVIGPNVAGILIPTSGWRGIFVINIPVCLIALAVGAWLLSDARPAAATRGSMDWIGIGLLSGGVLALMSGLTFATNYREPWLEPSVVGLTIGGIAALVSFFFWEGRVPSPVIDITLLRRAPFVAANVLSFGIPAFIFSAGSFQALYATQAYGYTASQNGLLLTPRGILSLASGTIASLIIARTGYRIPIVIGLAMASVSYFILSLRPGALPLGLVEVPEGVVLALVIALAGVGVGIVLPSANSTAIELMPEKATAIASLRGLFNILGNVIGTTAALVTVARFPDQVSGILMVFAASAFCTLALIGTVPFLVDGRKPVTRPTAPADGEPRATIATKSA